MGESVPRVYELFPEALDVVRSGLKPRARRPTPVLLGCFHGVAHAKDSIAFPSSFVVLSDSVKGAPRIGSSGHWQGWRRAADGPNVASSFQPLCVLLVLGVSYCVSVGDDHELVRHGHQASRNHRGENSEHRSHLQVELVEAQAYQGLHAGRAVDVHQEGGHDHDEDVNVDETPLSSKVEKADESSSLCRWHYPGWQEPAKEQADQLDVRPDETEAEENEEESVNLGGPHLLEALLEHHDLEALKVEDITSQGDLNVDGC
mmetsp:Transcript_1719/g.3263  ORF Transcript_1719/g.3263 Transcript_1719/m.3263 type:complete len:260 (-) Transcript_1719:3973-4752(-)